MDNKKIIIVLIIQYFKVTNNYDDNDEYCVKRQEEIDYCLVKNSENIFINEIHLLVEEIYDLYFISEKYKNKIKQICIGKRLSYADVFNYYNNNLSNQVCILLNADIYLDNSIEIIKHVNFDLNIMCLTRYEDEDNHEQSKMVYGSIVDLSSYKVAYIKAFQPSIWSQDGWIWKTPNINILDSNFNLGVTGCDNYIAYLFQLNNFNIINPSRLICLNHCDKLSSISKPEGICKGKISSIREERLKDNNYYSFLDNIDDIPDKYTLKTININNTNCNNLCTAKFIKNISQIIVPDNQIIASSYSQLHTPSNSQFEKNEYWEPTIYKNAFIQFNFNNITPIIVIDIMGKPISNIDNIYGFVTSFRIEYIDKNNNVVKHPIILEGISITNGNYIKRIYLNEIIECKIIRFYPLTYIGILALKIRMFKLNNFLIQPTIQERKVIKNIIINNKNLYYYDYDWQKPVITEYRIFKLFYQKKILLSNYFAFPWATFFDDYYKNKKNLLNILSQFKVQNNKNDNCFTVIQHIHFRKFLDIIKNINITHIFTPHKMIGDEILEAKYNIKIIPISLFPIQNNQNKIIDINKRKYLTSFIGYYSPKNYLSNIREQIFKKFKYDDCLIIQTNEWHYQNIVYNNFNIENIKNKELYTDTLSNSKFSLCPSGSGPNSIRIWESMSFGSIPVILADTLILPEIPNINYSDYFILWKETEIDKLYDYLKNFDIEKMNKMSENCITLYESDFSQCTMHNSIDYYFKNQNIQMAVEEREKRKLINNLKILNEQNKNISKVSFNRSKKPYKSL